MLSIGLRLAVFAVAMASTVASADLTEQRLTAQFEDQVRPFLATYCHSCHAGDDAEAALDLTRDVTISAMVGDHRVWKKVLDRLRDGEMPPEDEPQPTETQRSAVIEWIQSARQLEMQRHAGQPGVVPVRRLNSAEYNYTIRDLTGFDLQPARDFPVDPANEAGFDNSADSLSMSPALLTKYLDAARMVVDHLVLNPDGIDFAPHPVVTDTDRDKYCVNRIVKFYERQPTELAAYFYAAWRLRQSDEVSEATIADIAQAEQVSPRYLATVWSLLTDENDNAGPLARLRHMWETLPDDNSDQTARRECAAMHDYVTEVRSLLEVPVEDLSGGDVHKGSQTFVLWKNRQYVANRRKFNRDALTLANLPEVDQLNVDAADGDEPSAETPPHPDLVLPGEDDRPQYEAALARFCDVFPDTFYVSERGRDYLGKPKDEQEKGRLLSAGFHSMMGYFRDDAPLYELILSDAEQQELDRLWQELDFVTSAPMRQYAGFLWFERTDSGFLRDPEFDFARPEDRAALTEPMIERLAELYLKKAQRNSADEVVQQAIARYFEDINKQIRRVENARMAAEPAHLDALLEFAARAYRRDLSSSQEQSLVEFYHALRDDEGLSHEEAIRDTVVSVLLSPHFCFRVDLVGTSGGIEPRTDVELASRLSYFLWSSMPDEDLRAAAATGRLHDPEVLRRQVRRMLADGRIRGLATEFGGNWLDFRRFQEHNAVDREQFPQFTNDLRQAMFEEPLRFFVDLVQHDRSVLEFLEADHTFVNKVLADHYELTDITFQTDEWRRVENVGDKHRGGLLPMSVFLTTNSPGLRTSPVKRGYWVVRRLMGEEIPPPPPDIPELPQDERGLGDQTLAEALARHREHASCAGCHDRFDSIGLVFENYGPIGEWREVDLGGRPVSSEATFSNGEQGRGLAGLQRYLREHRQAEFLDNLCRKLLSYALGRTLLLSDEPLLETMQTTLEQSEYRFSVPVYRLSVVEWDGGW